MRASALLAGALTWLSYATTANAFYMPGYSVKSYSTGESIPLFANKIFSDHTHLQYAYYELPFVCPPKGKKLGNSPFTSGTSMSLNLGEVLRGDRIKVSDFDIVMDRDIECAPLCTLALDRKTMRRLQALIADGYVAEYILDNLPGATAFVTLDGKKKYYSPGFKLGYEDLPERDDEESDGAKHPRTRTFLNNHLTFVIRWRKAPGKAGESGKKVIVAFEIYTRSIENGPSTRADNGCPLHPAAEDVEPFQLHIPRNLTALLQEKGELGRGREDRSYTPPVDENVEDGATLAVPYSYSVYFREDESIQWAKRWSMYNHGKEKAGSAHGCAIATSLVIAIAMGVWVGMIWRRTAGGQAAVKSVEEGKLRLLSRSPSPISGKGKGDDDGKGRGGLFDEDVDEFSGWKLLHADVFRAPEYSGLFPPLVGSGTQFLFMFLGLLTLSLIGVLKPSYRGGFFSVGTGLFVFAGLFSGYYSGRLYKTFGGLSWRKNAIITALLFPGLSFALVFVINLFVWAQASSTAIPFGTLIVLLTLWLLIQLPLVYLGSYIGYICVPAYDHPTKTSLIPRAVPPRPWYLRTKPAIICSGLFPSVVMLMEAKMVFRYLVQDKSGYFDVSGCLSVIAVLLMLTIAEVSVIVTYMQLNAENHRWWWCSFFCGASSGAWTFAYCVWYFFVKAKIHGVASTLLFFSYSFLSCAVYGLLTGTVGCLAAYAFVRHLYKSIKFD